MKTVDLYFDYAPWAYIADELLPRKLPRFAQHGPSGATSVRRTSWHASWQTP